MIKVDIPHERERFKRIAEEHGIDYAIEWEIGAAQRYRYAMNQAIDPDTLHGAKGMEWAKIYCESARQCDEMVEEGKRLRTNDDELYRNGKMHCL